MKIIKNKKLAPLTNFKIGGLADFYIEIKKLEELFKLRSWLERKKLKTFILGGGTNLLVDDFKGAILKPDFRFIEKIDEGILKVGSGILVSELLDYVIERGYRGLEQAGGLPGTVGGAVEGSVGCFGGEFKNLVLEVEAVNLETADYKIFRKEECEFEYRNSFFRKNRGWLIISTTLSFETNFNKEELRKIANDPFPVIPIAFLISELGLKGKRIGDAQISEKHANFIINLGQATFNDVIELIDFVKKGLEDKFQIEPELEIQIVKE